MFTTSTLASRVILNRGISQIFGEYVTSGSQRALTSSAVIRAQQNSNNNSDLVSKKSSDIVEQKTDKDLDLQQYKVDRALFYPEQMEWLDDRLVRISRPTKNVMQSGTTYTHTWKIEFDSQPRGEYWLMGWTSTADPVSNLSLSFPTKEAAIDFCERNQLQWFVEEQPERKVRRKSYADNFSWNKRTRLGSK